MSQRARRALVVCVACLVACEAPAPEPAAPAPVRPTPEPTPTPKPEQVAEPEPPEPPEPPPPVAPELERAVVRSVNELTIDLQRALLKRPGNVFAAGMSVAVGLAMVHAGSDGATRKELEKLLTLEAPPADIHRGYAGLAARWNHPDPRWQLTHAARLFGAQQLAFKPAYQGLTRDVFAAPLEPLDFQAAPDAARGRIDAWVRQQSREKLTELVPAGSLTADTRLVLATAAFFKADWLEPFDPALTAPAPFHGEGGKREVQMMRSTQRLKVAFGKAGKLRVLELPYKGGEYSMVILLPGTRGGLAAVERTIRADEVQGWIDAGREQAIELHLPRFTLDTTHELAPALQKLGAASLFSAKKADLSAMASEPVALSAAPHRARVEVEERGVEATAATAIEVSVGGLPANPAPFVVDRPFLFYIRDVRTGALLCFGRLSDPT